MPAPAPTAAVDVVDERNEPIGIAQRGQVLPQGLNFRTVHVLVFDERDRVLLQRLSQSRERHPYRWGSSVAGYLHAGETYDRAARRRLEEEVGVQANVRFVGVTPMQDERSTKFIGVFTATTQHDEPEIRDPEHVASLKWFPFSQLPERMAVEPGTFTPSLIHVVNFLISVEGSTAAR